jgi:hypothetical protein
VGDTVQCGHKHGGCKCLDKAIALYERTGKPAFIATNSGKLKIAPNPTGGLTLTAV